MKENTIIRIHETGEPEVMKYETLPVAEPSPGEIRMKVEAIGVGFGECLYRRGFYIQDTVLPSSIGNNAVGTVDAVGSGVDVPKVGDRISLIPSFEMNRYSVYGHYAIVPAYAAAPYFESLSLEENASIWMQVTTAYGALVHYGKIKSDDTVLLIPASGGVGLAALQTCKKVGATSITTTRSREKAKRLKDLGADHVIITTEEKITSRVREITDGKGARIVFNAMTGPVLDDLVRATQPGGTIFQYGGIGGNELIIPLAPLARYGIRIQGYTLYELTYHPENLDEVRKFVSEGVKEGHYTANVGKVFEFNEMVQVHHYLEEGDMTGSVVVRV